MKKLLLAAIRTSKHYTLLVFTVSAMLLLSFSSQLEMFTLGILSSKGADFFTLFGDPNKSGIEQTITLDEVKEKWAQIEGDKKGAISQSDANVYLGKQKTNNPLQRLMYSVEAKFNFGGKNISALIWLILVVAIFKALGLFFSRYMTQILAIRVSRDLREQYFEHIQSLPMSFYHKYNIGALSARVVGDASQIAQSVNSFITNYIQAPFQITASLIGCFLLSWQLSLVIFAGLPLIALPAIFITRKVKAFTRMLQKNQERFSSVLIDYLSGVQTVKIFGMENFSLKKYREQNNEMARIESKTAKYDLLIRPILHTITSFCLATVLIFGLYVLKMSVSQLFVFCGLLYLFYEPVKKFTEENAVIQKGVVAAERMFEVLDLQPLICDKEDAIELCSFSESIEFDDVWFRYGNEWVLKGVSFTVSKGETVAIVGTTGAGKSTIVQLLPRLYDIQQGEIRIDGTSIKDFTQKSLRRQLGFVSQKPFLFYDTIASNIAFGKEFSKDEIEYAAQKAHAAEFIESLPDGYNTMLEETGKNFSGGQQQRIAIARALIKKSPILILDEATSSLDSLSEEKIKQAIQALHGATTQIIIAHRLSTIEHADRIIVLERGEKIAEGTKDELLTSCPQFTLMWETHFATSGLGSTS